MGSPNEFMVGEIRTRIAEQPHENRVYVERSQPNEGLILASNAEMRKYEQSMRGRTMVYAAKIPTLAYYTIIPRDYPLYLYGDGRQRKKTLRKMLRDHPEWGVRPGSKC